MPQLEPLYQPWILDLEQGKRQLRQAKQELRGVADESEQGLGRIERGLKRLVGGFAVGVLIHKLRQLAQHMFEVGTAGEETASKFETTFGDSTGTVDSFLEAWANLAGLTKTEGRDIVATIAAIGQGFGISKRESAEFAEQAVRIAGDLASFNNVRIEDTLAAVRSGLVGEIEPLRRFGINLSAAEVEMRALQDTGKRLKAELTDEEKIWARLALAYEKAGVQIGDLERTQNSRANATRRQAAELREMAEDIARSLLPTWGLLIDTADEIIDTMAETKDAFAAFVAEGVFGTVEGIGTLLQEFMLLLETLTIVTGAVDEASDGINLGLLDTLQRLGGEVETINSILREATQLYYHFAASVLDATAATREFLGLSEEGTRRQRELAQSLREEAAALDVLAEKQDEARRSFADRVAEQRDVLRRLLGDYANAGTVPSRGALFGQSGAEDTSTSSSGSNAAAERQAMKAVAALSDQLQLMRELEAPTRTLLNLIKERHDIEEALAELKESEQTLGQNITAEQRTQIQTLRQFWNERKQANQEAIADAQAIADKIREALTDPKRIEPLGPAGGNLRQVSPMLEQNIELTHQWQNAMLDVLDTVGMMVDLFGDANGNAAGLARGLFRAAQVGQRISNFDTRTTDAERVSAYAQLGGSILTAAQSVFQAFQDRAEAERRLRQSVIDNTRALETFSEQLFTQGVVGSNLSGAQVGQAQSIISGLLGGQNSNPDAVRSALGQLIDMGVVGPEILDLFQNMLDALALGPGGGAAEAAQAFQDALRQAAEDIGRLNSEIGSFGASLDGILEEIRIKTDAGLLDNQGQIDLFLERMNQAGIDLGGSLEALIRERLTGIDLTTAEGQAALQNLIQEIATAFGTDSSLFANLSPDQVERILDFFGGFVTRDGSSDGFTRSQAVARTITDVQTNELLALERTMLSIEEQQLRELQWLNHYMEATLARGETGSGLSTGVNINGDITINSNASNVRELVHELEQHRRYRGKL